MRDHVAATALILLGLRKAAPNHQLVFTKVRVDRGFLTEQYACR